MPPAALCDRHYQAIAGIIRAIAGLACAEVPNPERAAPTFVALRQGFALERSQPAPALDVHDVLRTLADWMRGLVGLAPAGTRQG